MHIPEGRDVKSAQTGIQLSQDILPQTSVYVSDRDYNIPDDIRHKVPEGEALLNELCTLCTNLPVIRSRLNPLAIRSVKGPDRCLYCENER